MGSFSRGGILFCFISNLHNYSVLLFVSPFTSNHPSAEKIALMIS